MIKFNFGKDFLWGAGTSAEQSEGKGNTNKGLTKWDLHYRGAQEDFYQQIGPEITSDFFNNWKSDIKMWANELKLKAIRLSFSWARIMPDGKEVSQEGLRFYHNVLDELKKYAIKPLMTLVHFDLPAWAIGIGGWANPLVVESYQKYAKLVFEEFDHKVYAFATFCEPIVPILCGYMGQKCHWPKVEDYQQAFDVGNGMILAHAKAVNLFNQQKRKAKIGVIINLSPTHPRDPKNEDDVTSAKNYDLIHNRWLLDSMVLGTFPTKVIKIFKTLGAKTFSLKSVDLEQIKKIKLDYLGVNYYFPTRIKTWEGEEVKSEFDKLAVIWKKPDAIYNKDRGWEILPSDIYYVAKLVVENYRNIPFYISENGIGVSDEERFRDSKGIINDTYRIVFIKEHLKWLHKAIQEGAACFGYTLWAVFDCWSWLNGYKNRYGLIEVDLQNQKRKLKKSAYWYANLIVNNGFEDEPLKIIN